MILSTLKCKSNYYNSKIHAKLKEFEVKEDGGKNGVKARH
jgi:hypothetical protein